MDKVQKPCNSKCYTSLSETFRFYKGLDSHKVVCSGMTHIPRAFIFMAYLWVWWEVPGTNSVSSKFYHLNVLHTCNNIIMVRHHGASTSRTRCRTSNRCRTWCILRVLKKQYRVFNTDRDILVQGRIKRDCTTVSHILREIWPPLWSSGQSSQLQVQRSGFDFRRYQIFWEVPGLEQGPLSLMSTIEERLGRKSSGSSVENREYGHRDPSSWPRGTLYSQKLALTLSTSSGRLVGVVHSQTQATEF
jgi:hypothetical protein